MKPVESISLIGDDALGVTLSDKSRRNDLANALVYSCKWLEVVPGTDGLSVQYNPLHTSTDEALKTLDRALRENLPPTEQNREALIIPVCYAPDYAPDMAHICAMTKLSPEEIITRHTSAVHQVDMIGFIPGYAYLEGGDPALTVPRLDTPRARLPAGSIGLAGGLCGVYALPGPGGWPLIGRTPLTLFDPAHKDPFLLQAGQSVRFEPISAQAFRNWV